jgi:2-keto-3-deoxy-L-rhamnonate aldolase RhmA
MEHGTFSASSTQHMIQAVKGDCSAIVRIPENSAVWIKKALDTGCDGIIVPLVNTAEAAKQAVASAKYPPQGARSVGIARAHAYGMSFAQYVASANEKVALIIQIEHIDAVNNLDAILDVKGIDGVLIGPYDLSGSLNILGNVTSEPVQAAISNIKEKCQQKSVPFGIFVMKAEAAQKEIEDGCKFVAVGIDSSLLWGAAKEALSIVKK